MDSLYNENHILGRLFRKFMDLFPQATKPKKKLLALFLIGQLCTEHFTSIRNLHKTFTPITLFHFDHPFFRCTLIVLLFYTGHNFPAFEKRILTSHTKKFKQCNSIQHFTTFLKNKNRVTQ